MSDQLPPLTETSGEADPPGTSTEQPSRPSWRTVGVREAFAQQPSPPPADWRWYEGLGVWILGLLVSGALASLLIGLIPADSGGAFVAGIVANVLLLVVMVVWLQVFHPGWAPRMGQPSHPGMDVATGLVGGIVIYVLIAGVFATLILSPLLDLVVGEPVIAPEQVSTDMDPVGLVVAGLFALIFAPIVEEFFFRGVLFRAFRTNVGFWPAAVISGVLFGAIHYQGGDVVPSLLLMIPLSLVGIAFAWIMERRGTILAPICAHIGFNIIGFIGIVVGI